MIKYKEITFYEFHKLFDKTGYYCVVYSSGGRDYFKDGFLHREDGPAQTWYDGGKIYWLNGSEYEDLNITDEEWIRIVKIKAFL